MSAELTSEIVTTLRTHRVARMSSHVPKVLEKLTPDHRVIVGAPGANGSFADRHVQVFHGGPANVCTYLRWLGNNGKAILDSDRACM